MGKRARQREKLTAPTSTYRSADGAHALELRGALSPATRREYADLAPKVREDLWQRQVEFLFERLAVAWTIDGVSTAKQKELLARYRMASQDERAFVRGALREHLAEWFPDVEAP
jgi:hypothetical protein